MDDVLGWNWPKRNDGDKMLNWAIRYLDLHFNVMPVESAGKRPRLISWENLQTERVTQEMVEEWWTRWPLANIALVCGEISDIVCLDIDDAERSAIPPDKIPITSKSQTSRGFHYFFKYPKGSIPFPSFKGEGYDMQSNGKYVILPPSEHASGAIYTWLVDPWSQLEPFAQTPTWLKAEAIKAGVPVSGNGGVIKPLFDMDGYFRGVEQGGRNNAAARLAGYLFSRDRDYEEVLCTVHGWNLRNTPPLHPAEVKQVVDSVYKKHGRGGV